MKRAKKPALAELALVPEPLGLAGPKRELCRGCGLYKHCKTPFMRPFVPKGWTRRLLVVGEAPGEHEDRHSGRSFTGPAGRLLRRLLREAGYGPLDVAYVNACRCRPRRNATPTMAQVRACRPFLLRVLQVLRPRAVVAIGASALRALTNDGRELNVTAARGRRLLIPGLEEPPVARATYHPAAVLRGAGHLAACIRDDLTLAEGPELEWPKEGAPVGSAIVAVDTEYTPDGRVLTVAAADPFTAQAAEVSANLDRDVVDAIRGAATLVGHNVAVDVDSLIRLGLAKERWADGTRLLDSLLLARMENENLGRGAYRLERCLLARYNVQGWKDETEDLGPDATTWSSEQRIARCRLDAWAAAMLVHDMTGRKGAPPAELVEFTHRIAMVVHRIRLAGVYIDLERLRDVARYLQMDMQKARDLLERAAFRAGMTEFSPTNDGHLRELLFDRLGLEVQERTRTERLPAVNKVTLRALAEQHDVPKLVLDFNRAEKLYSTYVEGIQRVVQALNDERGWLEVRINPLGARTGRRSSGGRDEDAGDAVDSAPNMQNWPGCKKTCSPDCRQHPKQVVVSRYPGGLIGNFDYRSLEPLILAHIARDERLYEAFTKGGGYIAFGRDLFGREVEKDTDQYRALKGVILGTHYGAEEWRIAYQLWHEARIRLAGTWERHLERTAELRKRYLKAVPGVRQYMAARRNELLRTQQVVGLLGRVRHLPHSFTVRPARGTPEWRTWKHLANEAINFPIQWAAACVTGSALIDVERELATLQGYSLLEWHEALLRREWPGSVLVNEVHDALVVDIHPDGAEKVKELVIETMRAVPTLRRLDPTFTLRLDVDPKVGPRWGG